MLKPRRREEEGGEKGGSGSFRASPSIFHQTVRGGLGKAFILDSVQFVLGRVTELTADYCLQGWVQQLTGSVLAA
jgi:hypothetical protein